MAICRSSSWATQSNFIGQTVVDGTECDEYQLVAGSYLLVLDLIAGTNIPFMYVGQSTKQPIGIGIGSDTDTWCQRPLQVLDT
jgi:hypothetical protein